MGHLSSTGSTLAIPSPQGSTPCLGGERQDREPHLVLINVPRHPSWPGLSAECPRRSCPLPHSNQHAPWNSHVLWGPPSPLLELVSIWGNRVTEPGGFEVCSTPARAPPICTPYPGWPRSHTPMNRDFLPKVSGHRLLHMSPYGRTPQRPRWAQGPRLSWGLPNRWAGANDGSYSLSCPRPLSSWPGGLPRPRAKAPPVPCPVL